MDIFTVVNGVATRVTNITLDDGTVVSSIYSPLGQFLTGSFQVTAPAGSGLQPVELEFKPQAGAVDFVLNALDIVQTQNPLTLTQAGISQGNGFELVTISGTGATPNSLVTVDTTLGTIAATDEEANYAGTQVLADASGNFTFTVQTILGGQTTFSAQEVTGASFGQTTVSLGPPSNSAWR